MDIIIIDNVTQPPQETGSEWLLIDQQKYSKKKKKKKQDNCMFQLKMLTLNHETVLKNFDNRKKQKKHSW